MEFGIENCVIYLMLEITNNERNRTANSKKESELDKKRKITSTWQYWKWTLSNR